MSKNIAIVCGSFHKKEVSTMLEEAKKNRLFKRLNRD
jgi:hypothetical protein